MQNSPQYCDSVENNMQHAVHTYGILVPYFQKSPQTPAFGDSWCFRNVLFFFFLFGKQSPSHSSSTSTDVIDVYSHQYLRKITDLLKCLLSFYYNKETLVNAVMPWDLVWIFISTIPSKCFFGGTAVMKL